MAASLRLLKAQVLAADDVIALCATQQTQIKALEAEIEIITRQRDEALKMNAPLEEERDAALAEAAAAIKKKTEDTHGLYRETFTLRRRAEKAEAAAAKATEQAALIPTLTAERDQARRDLATSASRITTLESDLASQARRNKRLQTKLDKAEAKTKTLQASLAKVKRDLTAAKADAKSAKSSAKASAKALTKAQKSLASAAAASKPSTRNNTASTKRSTRRKEQQQEEQAEEDALGAALNSVRADITNLSNIDLLNITPSLTAEYDASIAAFSWAQDARTPLKTRTLIQRLQAAVLGSEQATPQVMRMAFWLGRYFGSAPQGLQTGLIFVYDLLTRVPTRLSDADATIHPLIAVLSAEPRIAQVGEPLKTLLSSQGSSFSPRCLPLAIVVSLREVLLTLTESALASHGYGAQFAASMWSSLHTTLLPLLWPTLEIPIKDHIDVPSLVHSLVQTYLLTPAPDHAPNPNSPSPWVSRGLDLAMALERLVFLAGPGCSSNLLTRTFPLVLSALSEESPANSDATAILFACTLRVFYDKDVGGPVHTPKLRSLALSLLSLPESSLLPASSSTITSILDDHV